MEDMTIKVRKVNKDEKFKRMGEEQAENDDVGLKPEAGPEMSFETPSGINSIRTMGRHKNMIVIKMFPKKDIRSTTSSSMWSIQIQTAESLIQSMNTGFSFILFFRI